jgi:ankyrin
MDKKITIGAGIVGVLAASAGAAVGLHYWERQQARSDLDAVGISYSEANFIDEACAGNRAAVVLFLKTGMSPRTRGKDDITPLHCAARHGQEKLVQLLITRGAEVDARSKDERSPLHEASAKGSVEAIQRLLDAGANINAASRTGDTPLLLAGQRKTDVVTLLLAKGADAKTRNKNGETALLRVAQYAQGKESLDLADQLLKSGADPNAATNDGRTPLINAIGSGNKAMVEKLLAAGGDINARSTNTTALIAAGGRIELLKLLLEHKADPNLTTDNGQTALEQVVRLGNVEAARLLLDAGAKVDAGLSGRDGPLHNAASMGNYDLVQLLLSKGADANARGQGGRTPLHAIASAGRSNDAGRLNGAKLLLEFGAKTDTINSQGQTPSMLAQQMGNAELLELLSPRTNVRPVAGQAIPAARPGSTPPPPGAPQYRYGSSPMPAPAPALGPYPRGR